jgi:hypothetical protein
MISYTTTLPVSIEQVWQHLLYKIEHPEAFVPGVSKVQVLEKKEDAVLRQMEIVLNGAASAVIEKITWEPYRVRFELVAHDIYDGYVDNVAAAIDAAHTELCYSIHWRHKQTGEMFTNEELVKNAVLQSAAYILKG